MFFIFLCCQKLYRSSNSALKSCQVSTSLDLLSLLVSHQEWAFAVNSWVTQSTHNSFSIDIWLIFLSNFLNQYPTISTSFSPKYITHVISLMPFTQCTRVTTFFSLDVILEASVILVPIALTNCSKKIGFDMV